MNLSGATSFTLLGVTSDAIFTNQHMTQRLGVVLYTLDLIARQLSPASAWLFLPCNLVLTWIYANSLKEVQALSWAIAVSLKTLIIPTSTPDTITLLWVCSAPLFIHLLRDTLCKMMPDAEYPFIRQIISPLPEALGGITKEMSMLSSALSLGFLVSIIVANPFDLPIRQQAGLSLAMWGLQVHNKPHALKVFVIGVTAACCTQDALVLEPCDMMLGLLIVPNVLSHFVFFESPPYTASTCYSLIMCGGLFNLMRTQLEFTEVIITVTFVHLLLSLIVVVSVSPPSWAVVTRFDLLTVLLKALYIGVALQASISVKLAFLDALASDRFSLEMSKSFAQTAFSLLMVNVSVVYLSINSAHLKELKAIPFPDTYLNTKVQYQCRIFSCISVAFLCFCLIPISSLFAVVAVAPMMLTFTRVDSLEHLVSKNFGPYSKALGLILNCLCFKHMLLDRMLVASIKVFVLRHLHTYFGGLALARLGAYLETPYEAEGIRLAVDIAALLVQQCTLYICAFKKHAYYPKLNVLPISILVFLFCKTSSLNLLGLWSASYIICTLDIYL
mmetsp:Transcript_34588/g.60740  ORF Transcript_34588/g.60740 Transcript_34588/m.60740 type:complete len:558 (-) Transcript_34588:1322-2995(-)